VSDESRIIARIQRAETDLIKAQRAAEAEKLSMYAIAQDSASEEFSEWSELNAFNPLAMSRRFETLDLKARKKAREEHAQEVKQEEEVTQVEEPADVVESAQKAEQSNPELRLRNLLALRARLRQSDTPEKILEKVLQEYPDTTLADEALDFLFDTAEAAFAASIQAAKEELNARRAREIRAGKNISARAREYAEKGLGDPTFLRDLYRDITGNPRDPAQLFEELSDKYPFDKMKAVIDFILHALGADLKAKGSSINRGELHRLISDARALQAILGVYRFFKGRMNLVQGAFQRSGLVLPIIVTFERLSRQFVRYLNERYPTAEKILNFAGQFGLESELDGFAIICTQLRDAVRGVAPKLFRSQQHRQEVLNAYLEALEKLQEELEENDENDEKEEKKK
jgi:type III secretion protein W